MKKIKILYKTFTELFDTKQFYWIAYYYMHYIKFSYMIQHAKEMASPKMREVFEIAHYALKTHHKVNQCYNKHYPYFFHLWMIYEQALLFKHLLTEDEFVLAVKIIFLHDIIEDARLTYNDVKQMYGEDVANGVYACTELRGKNRKERHGTEYYALIKLNKIWTFCKLCDIHGNVTFSKMTGSSMFAKYKSEYFGKVKRELYRKDLNDIFNSFEQNLFV